jgi:hypothetical protein
MPISYMGSHDLTTLGGLVEIDLNGNVIGQYDAARRGGPERYIPSVKGVRDTGLLAHPHGIDYRRDLGIVVTSDFADPSSIAANTIAWNPKQDLGTTVRVWDASHLASGPRKIVQVPPGADFEANRVTNVPEGLMEIGLTHLHQHKGVFTASMMGGALFYSADITAPAPVFHEVYDIGPATGAGIFVITPDDRYLVMAVSGILSPGDPDFERDYKGEHSRRLLAFDIRRLLAAGPRVECNGPRVFSGIFGYSATLPPYTRSIADMTKKRPLKCRSFWRRSLMWCPGAELNHRRTDISSASHNEAAGA